MKLLAAASEGSATTSPAGSLQDLTGAPVAKAAGHASEADRGHAVHELVSAHAVLPPAELVQSLAGAEEPWVGRRAHRSELERPRDANRWDDAPESAKIQSILEVFG